MGTARREGDKLTEIRKEVSREHIALYAEASGDFNPIHIDQEYGEKSPFGSNIAHGMMVAASISELMGANFGSSWNKTGKMKIKFSSPVFPGDVIKTSGFIKKVAQIGRKSLVQCTVSISKQTGEKVISGDTSVTLTK